MSANLSSMGHRMVAGSTLTIGAKVLTRGLHFLATIIIARILAPADFGVVALALALQGVVQTFGHAGMHLALIRDQNAARAHYDSVWTFGLIRGAAIAAAFVVIAPYAGDWFDEPRVRSVILVFAALTMARSLENVGVIDFRKHLRFSKEFAFQFYAQVPNFLVTVSLAFALRSYWAIVLGMCAERITAVVLSYVMSDYRPRLSLSAWRELFDFSKWMLVNNILSGLSQRADVFVLGRMVDSATLGLYSLAFRLTNQIIEQFVQPSIRPLLPGLSKVRADRPAFERMLLHAIALILFVAAPLAVMTACTAEFLIVVLFGARWAAAGEIASILALYVLVRACLSGTVSAVVALGRPRIVAALATIRFAVLVPLLVWGISLHGIYGAALALLASGAVRLIANYVVIVRFLKISLGSILSFVWRTFAATALMAGAIVAVRSSHLLGAPNFASVAQLLVLLATGASAYLAVHFLLWAICRFPDGPERKAVAIARRALKALGR